jgi:hypothetical protein
MVMMRRPFLHSPQREYLRLSERLTIAIEDAS